MAYLDHICERCTHQWLWHTNQSCSNGACHCKHGDAKFAPPRVVMTLSPTGRENRDLTTPGEWVFYPNTLTCACPECVAMHLTLTEGVNR